LQQIPSGMNAIGLSILVVLIVVVLLAPRRWAMLGMIAGVLYLTQGQAIEVLGLHLFAMRFLEMAGFARVMMRREYSLSKLNGIDRAFILLYSYTTVVFLLRSTEGQAYQVGLAVDAMLCYFTFRGLIESIEDFRWFLFAFLVLLGPYLVLVSVESSTGHNPFAFMGGIPEHIIREGRPRCIGSFRHPDLMGTLGATFLPLYLGLAFANAKRAFALLGVGLCLGIVFFSNSGGPASAAAAGLVGWLFWYMRTKMVWVRRAIVGSIILLALVMKAPVWYLLAKVSSLTGGDGWHRSYLLDVAFRNLDKWWQAGMSTIETQDWFPYSLALNGEADITNQFLSFGVAAGLVAIALLIFVLIRAYRSIGIALTATRSGALEPGETEFMLWGLGVMLSVHVVNWFGISYFDQIYVVWFMQLAAISVLSDPSSLEHLQSKMLGEKRVLSEHCLRCFI
jgi:hypothetical protein